MRIAICGLSGCGNTSVARLAGANFGYPVFNYTFRCSTKERLNQVQAGLDSSH